MSCAATTLKKIERKLGGDKFDMLFIDGDHEYPGVKSDLLQYSRWTREGTLIAFHDVVPDNFIRYGRPGPQYSGEVYLLWRQLKRRFKNWEFIASPDQSGSGIGVIEVDGEVVAKLKEIERLRKDQE